MQSASSLYPLATTFQKRFDSYTHTQEFGGFFSSKLVCECCESHQTSPEMGHVYSSPSFTHADVPSR